MVVESERGKEMGGIIGDGWNGIIGEGVHALRVLVRCGVLTL